MVDSPLMDNHDWRGFVWIVTVTVVAFADLLQSIVVPYDLINGYLMARQSPRLVVITSDRLHNIEKAQVFLLVLMLLWFFASRAKTGKRVTVVFLFLLLPRFFLVDASADLQGRRHCTIHRLGILRNVLLDYCRENDRLPERLFDLTENRREYYDEWGCIFEYSVSADGGDFDLKSSCVPSLLRHGRETQDNQWWKTSGRCFPPVLSSSKTQSGLNEGENEVGD